MKKKISIFMIITMLFAVLSGSSVFNAATYYNGVSFTRYDFDYAPSAMYGDGPNIKMWWGGGTGTGDGIYYSTLSSSGWSTPVMVLSKSSSGWDSYHTCDPSVIKGAFKYNGTTYAYAMYYTGTYDAVGYDSHIGVAFSNDGINWIKYPSPVINPIGSAVPSTLQYGAGMESVYISNGVITMMYFDSTGTGNKIYVATSTDGINFSGRTLITVPLSGEQHAGDIAYSPSESKWYVSTKKGDDSEIYLYETTGSSLTSGWNYTGCISSVTTGKVKNHNPGWLRYPNGDIYIEAGTEYKYVYYGSGTANTATWDIAQSIYTKGWEFNVQGNTQGWTMHNTSSTTPNATGQWIFSTSLADPHIDSRAIEFPASAFSKIQMSIANQNSTNAGKIYFKTATENYYSEDKTVSFTCINGGSWNIATINMASNAKWTGKITGIRIDPVENGSGGAIGIDYIRLTN